MKNVRFSSLALYASFTANGDPYTKQADRIAYNDTFGGANAFKPEDIVQVEDDAPVKAVSRDAVNFTSHSNGAIRDASGKLAAFYDAERHELAINGFVQKFGANDIEHAMDIVADKIGNAAIVARKEAELVDVKPQPQNLAEQTSSFTKRCVLSLLGVYVKPEDEVPFGFVLFMRKVPAISKENWNTGDILLAICEEHAKRLRAEGHSTTQG